MDELGILAMATTIVSSHVTHNTLSAEALPGLIRSVWAALKDIESPPPVPTETKSPIVPIKGSVERDSIACLECGRKFSMLRRHLRTEHGWDDTEYRKLFNLPKDYPMVAPDYSRRRGDIAKKFGLGRKGAAAKKTAARAARVSRRAA